MTPRSYSRRILIDAEAMIMRKTIKKRIAGEIPVIKVIEVPPPKAYKDAEPPSVSKVVQRSRISSSQPCE
jgi:hypothetical protein